ncbi:hypothetical protein SAMN04489760_10737 [Syntrophus gentianae]|uniref:Lipid A 3-O-deacylase (PagL) n=1 Tax=Syntrophus gentianae TaxID=43775 RepID=A0A1H7WM00_9BACT|nr:hypothetical protein [Syntrophus gentianae]SEM22553.1 hypothetical protein SAMN04489760_10737 [Syntrophus gentianae]
MNAAFLYKMLKSVGVFSSFILIFFPVPWMDAGAKDWTVTIYGAIQARSDFDEMFYDPDFDNDYKFIAVALNRKIGSFTKHMDFECEAQVVKHFDGQNHMEFNGLVIARWLTFLWDEYIDTSLAVGDGLSWATETPKLEALEHEKTSALLDYVLVEVSLSLPQAPEWSLVWRIHHRSGVFGLFNGVHGGSNALGVGLSYHF